MTSKSYPYVYTFESDGSDFSALIKAEKWATDNGYVIGSVQRNNPIGLHRGAEYISKWSNMTREEQASLDGRMEAFPSFRTGVVVVRLKDLAVARAGCMP